MIGTTPQYTVVGCCTSLTDDHPRSTLNHVDYIGDVLSMSPLLAEKYLSAAEQVPIRKALGRVLDLRATRPRHAGDRDATVLQGARPRRR